MDSSLPDSNSSFDLDLPLEVDDEYWETGFVQPDGQPSVIAYFNSYLSLMDILAYAMRLIVSLIVLISSFQLT
jgi:hypothetical protein